GVFVPKREALVVGYILRKEAQEDCFASTPILNVLGLHRTMRAIKHTEGCLLASQITPVLRQSENTVRMRHWNILRTGIL
ncbi:MAG: hypothetical protein ABIR37_01965, partial [Candidatus Saccharimonadales bacterium]